MVLVQVRWHPTLFFFLYCKFHPNSNKVYLSIFLCMTHPPSTHVFCLSAQSHILLRKITCYTAAMQHCCDIYFYCFRYFSPASWGPGVYDYVERKIGKSRERSSGQDTFLLAHFILRDAMCFSPPPPTSSSSWFVMFIFTAACGILISLGIQKHIYCMVWLGRWYDINGHGESESMKGLNLHDEILEVWMELCST